MVRRDSADPRLVQSNTDKADGRRAKDLSDTLDPKCMLSMTDKEDPRTVTPNKDSVEAKRTKLLSEIADPRFAISSTEREAPKRANDRRDNDEPRLLTSITDSENREPNRATPRTES